MLCCLGCNKTENAAPGASSTKTQTDTGATPAPATPAPQPGAGDPTANPAPLTSGPTPDDTPPEIKKYMEEHGGQLPPPGTKLEKTTKKVEFN